MGELRIGFAVIVGFVAFIAVVGGPGRTHPALKPLGFLLLAAALAALGSFTDAIAGFVSPFVSDYVPVSVGGAVSSVRLVVDALALTVAVVSVGNAVARCVPDQSVRM